MARTRWRSMKTVPRNSREIRLRRVGDPTTYTGRWCGSYWRTKPWTWHLSEADCKWAPAEDHP